MNLTNIQGELGLLNLKLMRVDVCYGIRIGLFSVLDKDFNSFSY